MCQHGITVDGYHATRCDRCKRAVCRHIGLIRGLCQDCRGSLGKPPVTNVQWANEACRIANMAEPKDKPANTSVWADKREKELQERFDSLLEEIDSLADFVADSLELRVGETNILQRLNDMAEVK
jgi:hypothetical protein